MEKTRDNILFILFTFIAAFSAFFILNPLEASAAVRKCYTISSGNTIVYDRSGNRYGTIYGSDEITVLDVTSWRSRVRYPVSRGRTKEGYINTSAILTAVSGTQYKASAKITTYRRPGGGPYGYISQNDTVMVLGKSGNYTQVKYPVIGGYKYAFVTTGNAENYIMGADNGSGHYAAISNGTYVVRSALDHNKVIDAYGQGEVADGTNIQLCSYNGGANQKYTITHVGSGWYKIICNWGDKSLDVARGETRDEVNVQLYGWHGGNNQLWRFLSAGNGYYYIQSRVGTYLDVWNCQTSDETNIQTCQLNGGNNQKWKLEQISGSDSDITDLQRNITVFSQTDSRWGNVSYGRGPGGTRATVSQAGCGVLSYVNAVYYMTGNFIQPAELASWSVAQGYRINGVGTSLGLYAAYANAKGDAYGFRYSGSVNSVRAARSHLQAGGTAIISVPNHLMALAAYHDGKYLILDSYKSSNRGTYQTGYRWLTESEFTGNLRVSDVRLLSKK